MTTPGLLIVFTEGDRVRGLGHVSRCSAYAEGWLLRGGQVCWVLDGDAVAIAAIGSGQDVIRRRWQEDGETPSGLRAEIALVDSYVASAEAIATIASNSDVTVFIDDLGSSYPSGVVVHPAPDRPAAERCGSERVLNGPSWQPLRPPFWDLPERLPVRPDIERILVIFGGGDLHGIGVPIARLARQACPAASIDLVLGAGQPAPPVMPGVSVHQAIDAAAMASLMQAADIAISSAGQTVFELARCGTPAILVGTAANQKANLDHWPALSGYIVAGVWGTADLEPRVKAAMAQLRDPVVRQSIGARAVGVVDGQGVRRLFDHLERFRVQERV
jgi:spore coat polysaccharide biosynthesis predicted glycosyltransferase SpsG